MPAKVNPFTGKLDLVDPANIGTVIGSATAGSVLFAGVGGVLAQDNANLFYDDVTNQLKVMSVARYQMFTYFV